RHLLVVLDLVVSFVEVIVKDEVAFFGRQNPQTGMQAFAFATDNRIHEERYRRDFHRDFLSPARLPDDVSSYPVKRSARFAAVVVLYVSQPGDYAIDCFVDEILRVVQAFRNKHSQQARTDDFILAAGAFSISIQPG